MVTAALRVEQIPDSPIYNEREILRYARIMGGRTDELPLDECLELARGYGGGRVVWRILPCNTETSGLALGTFSLISADLAKALSGCQEAVVFAATLGVGMDRLIARYQKISPVRSLLLHSIGAERIERVCDVFCGMLSQTLRDSGKRLKPRFSPGYGDLSLETQRQIFALLDCERQIGLTLNGSLIMSPSKSVTAIAGITWEKE